MRRKQAQDEENHILFWGRRGGFRESLRGLQPDPLRRRVCKEDQVWVPHRSRDARGQPFFHLDRYPGPRRDLRVSKLVLQSPGPHWRWDRRANHRPGSVPCKTSLQNYGQNDETRRKQRQPLHRRPRPCHASTKQYIVNYSLFYFVLGFYCEI